MGLVAGEVRQKYILEKGSLKQTNIQKQVNKHVNKNKEKLLNDVDRDIYLGEGTRLLIRHENCAISVIFDANSFLHCSLNWMDTLLLLLLLSRRHTYF